MHVVAIHEADNNAAFELSARQYQYVTYWGLLPCVAVEILSQDHSQLYLSLYTPDHSIMTSEDYSQID